MEDLICLLATVRTLKVKSQAPLYHLLKTSYVCVLKDISLQLYWHLADWVIQHAKIMG